MQSTTDGELVRQFLSGRSAAGDELVRRWSARVLALCHARVRSAHVAEDLAQETLLRALRSLETLESPEKFRAWLWGIAHHVCLDWLKSKQSSQVPFTSLSPDQQADGFLSAGSVSGVCEVEQADELRQLMIHVESLPDDFREVLMLYYYHDVTYRDLAELLGVSTATINARLTKARAILRERFSASRR